ncbi:phosphomannomutase/phosphoglucomutase [Microbulbifer aggregans]|uniref:phosphomannomutase/phosphoglucomutase n=1 Tax=Microbulbifer aggregans TaxID=1769779 RepID=UPI001CFD22AD|nr:phosphomannomutase/phosphoglucomutase [Microbulbifer aggregans]
MASQTQTEKKPLLNSGILLPALLVAAIWLGGSHLLFTNIIAERNAASVQAASQQAADDLAAQLQPFFSTQRKKLQDFSSEPGGSTRSRSSKVLPQASVQLFAPEELSVGVGKPPLSFALVDLLKRSLEGQQPQPEFLQGSDRQWHLYNAVADTRGALLIEQPFTVFTQQLDALDLSAGKVQISQQFADGPARSLWTSPVSESTGNAATAKVPGSHLQVSLSPSAAFVAQHSIPASWIYTLATLGLLGTLYVLWRNTPGDTAAPWEKAARRGSTAKDKLRKEDLEAKPTAAQPAAVATEPQAAAAAPQAEEGTADHRALMRTPSTDFPRHVFRAYDIRGVAGEEINEPFAYQLGRALGTLALQAGEEILLIGRDGRNSSEMLRDCLIEGILESGCNAVDLGLVPSPVLYFACAKAKNTSSGVVVTASHNPADYNGFKMVLGGRPLADDKLADVYELMKSGKVASGQGSHHQQDVSEAYIDEIFNDVALAGQPQIVIDAGNGATSELAPELFEQLGCAVETLYCEVDGNFPNHAPDPSRPENLQALIEAVKNSGADLGIALDGDGDRVTLITSSGRIVWADQLVMLLARDILARNPGADIVFDVKSSRALGDLVNQYGGRPIMWKTGHAPMKTKMLETGALLGGELSGHIFIKDRWYGFDDGSYAAARVLEIMALREQSLDELIDSLPQMINTPEILLPVAESEKFALVDRLRASGKFGQADLNTIDGLRIEFADGWGLVRASNTTAALTLRFEADNEQALERIRQVIASQLQKLDQSLVLPG